MQIQIFFVIFFALNMLIFWLTAASRKFIWYRFIGYPLFLIIPLATVFFPQPQFELDHFWWKAAGVIAVILGAATGLWAKIEMDKDPEALATAGPYRLIRHPVYLGLIFIVVGWWWAWAAVYSFYFGMFILALVWIQAYLEEKLVLEKKFGNKYREYRRQAGMFWVK